MNLQRMLIGSRKPMKTKPYFVARFNGLVAFGVPKVVMKILSIYAKEVGHCDVTITTKYMTQKDFRNYMELSSQIMEEKNDIRRSDDV